MFTISITTNVIIVILNFMIIENMLNLYCILFQSIPNFEELPCTAASQAIVASKNRFLNILPIDATRVILNLLNNDPATDYINGNYISVC